MGHAAHGSVNPANDISGSPRTVGVILPVLNEADMLPTALEHLRQLSPDEIIVVDGGSTDATRDVAKAKMDGLPVRLLTSTRGRARQMNTGAAEARSDILLFLHADTRLPSRALESVRAAVRAGHIWGRFDVRLDNPKLIYRVIEWFMNLRSALTGIATGDQAVFVRRDVFEQLGGHPDIALMEDIELSARLRRKQPPARIRTPVLVSARRWERRGIVRTVLLMWGLRLCYWLGISPVRLARWYDA